jgi:hypothetical protein
MDQLINNAYICRFCNKVAKSKSGLTLHEKTCSQSSSNLEGKETDMVQSAVCTTPKPSGAPTPAPTPAAYRQERSGNSGNGVITKNPFQFGAFLVMADYVPILLDVNFCIALGSHILEHGSSNSAIMAFAHQLQKLDED